MAKQVTKFAVLTVVIIGLLGAATYFRPNPMTKQQLKALNEILSARITGEQVETIKLPDKTARKFPAVNKMFKVAADKEKSYALTVSPVGYRAPINLMVVIDAKKNEVMGIKVIQHNETSGYGNSLTETWFVNRFKGKAVDKYLQRVVLEAKDDNDIIQITGATVSTQAVINGVNSAMGIYRETVLGEKAEPVPLKVEGYVTATE
ncbi:MAG: FMN-binding protein [Syntrophomonas sp.]